MLSEPLLQWYSFIHLLDNLPNKYLFSTYYLSTHICIYLTNIS